MIHEWELTFKESLCACILHVNTCSIWDISNSWTRCIRTTKSTVSPNMSPCHFWSFQQQLQFPLATPEECAGWCGSHNLWVSPKRNNQEFMSGEHGGQELRHPKRSGNWFYRTRLWNTSCMTSKTTFAVCGCAPSSWKNVTSTCPAPWLTGITSYAVTKHTLPHARCTPSCRVGVANSPAISLHSRIQWC
jgi:hypothetical protein